jgi:glutathione synthase/RimK-type ligase-like ATP-grasp enzyme
MKSFVSGESLLWVTDPWETLSHEKDTTLRLIEEGVNLGLPIWWSSSDLILSARSPDRWRVSPVGGAWSRNRDLSSFCAMQETSASEFRQVHFRLDPPVNRSYLSLAKTLSDSATGGEGLLNPFEVLSGQSEKLPPPELLHLAPAHQVMKNGDDLAVAVEFVADREAFVTKPMNLAQSIGVALHRTPASRQELEALLLHQSNGGTKPLFLQEYLPGIEQGEVRLWFAMGHFIGSLRKFAKTGDFRVLIDEGSRIEAHTPCQEELAMIEEIGASLRGRRIALAAIDLISGRISDFNITSPGLLVQLEQVHGRNFARVVLDSLLKGF